MARAVMASDVYRLDNGLYVVSGHGAGVGGEAGRAGVCAVRVVLDGRVEVLGRRAVGAATATSHLSLMVSRSRNRVCVAHAGGVSVVRVDPAGKMASSGELAVVGYVTGSTVYPWYRGLGVDLGGGRVVQLFSASSRPELVVVDVGDDGVAARVVGTVRKHQSDSGTCRRACTAGAHLVLPGGDAGRFGPVDIVRVAAADPAAWSHVRRYTISDMYAHGHPCVVGGQIVLVYRSYPYPQPPQDARRAVMGAARTVAAWGGRGLAAGATHTPSGLPRPSPHAIVTSHTLVVAVPAVQR